MDNDGDLDLYVTNIGRNIYYENDGRGTFYQDTTTVPIITGIDAYNTSAICGDVDDDGDLDIITSSKNARSGIAINTLDNQNYLKLRLKGTTSNLSAVGAKVNVYRSGYVGDRNNLVGFREVCGGSGYMSMNDLEVHFGLDRSEAYDIEIVFPSGKILTRRDVRIPRILTVTETSGFVSSVAHLQHLFF